MDKLQRARGAFADLLNALDEARASADVTEDGEDMIDRLVVEIERVLRTFDATFAERAK